MKKIGFISEKEYKEILEKMPVACVDIIIKNKENKILLIKRKEGFWWTPGGRIFKNEKTPDAVLRKAFEETGLRVKIKKLVSYFDYFSDKNPLGKIKDGFHSISLVFLAEVEDEHPKVALDNTSVDYKWIDKIDESLHPILVKCLKESGLFN